MKDNLGSRMKTYESVSKSFLMRRTPVIIRIDGKAFHTLTKGFQRPFDDILMEAMQETTKYLCANIQGCKMGYTQSDEISLLLTDYETLNTCSWFDSNVQKMASISASMATLAFNKIFSDLVRKRLDKMIANNQMLDGRKMLPSTLDLVKYKSADDYVKDIKRIYSKDAMFDSRVFTIPVEEVCNYFVWRQEDATRNSIQMLAQSNFSHKELQKLSCNKLQDKLFKEKNINWNDLAVSKKRGTCIVKEKYIMDNELKTTRTRWVADKDIPIFTKDRQYIEKNL
jgi:tRNA(His) guanylyltransferase